MTRSRLGRVVLATVGVAALTSVLFVSPGGASASADDLGAAFDRGVAGNAQLTVAATYRKAYPDLSVKAAKAAAAAQLGAERFKGALADRQASYGGGWFDPYTASYHIAVTNTATANDLATVGRSLKLSVKTHLVDRSLAQLEQAAAELRTGTSDLARAADGHVGIDVKTNQVVVTVPATESASRLAAPAGVRVKTGAHLVSQDDVCSSRADCDDSLRSGPVIRRAGSEVCSAGFTARSGGTRWLLTAGHCLGSTGETWSTGTTTQRTIGTATDNVNSGAADATAIQVTNSFYTGSSAGVIYVDGSSTAPIKGQSTVLVNDVVCISARFAAPGTSGNPCATVKNLSDSDRRGQIRIESYDACPGDSGGGWYWLPSSGNRYAIGLHSGSLTGCNVSNGVSWASPLGSFWTGLTYETS